MSHLVRILAVFSAALLISALQWKQEEIPLQSGMSPIPIFRGEEGYHPWLIHVPRGRFTIGSTKSLRRELQGKDRHRPRKLRMEHSFFIMSTELSVRVASQLKPGVNFKHPQCVGDCPAVNISWRDALELANLLSEATGFTPCYELGTKRVRWPKGVACEGYRLPLEEEWEYAAKAGTTGFLYAGGNELKGLGWYRLNSRMGPHEIAAKNPNALGIYDLSGNVWEWCWDGWEKFDDKWKKRKVIRGGAWSADAPSAKVEHRSTKHSKQLGLSIGVRFVRTNHDNH